MEVMAVRKLRPNAVSHTDDGRLIGQPQRDDYRDDHWDSNPLRHRTGIWTSRRRMVPRYTPLLCPVTPEKTSVRFRPLFLAL
jgi:hypothetical protein